MSHQLSLNLQPLMELIISSPAHIPHSKMESQKGSIDTYQRNGSCSDVWQPCPPLSSKISGPMLVGGLFHRGLYHQPPSSVLGDITPYPCLFGSPPDYENIILFFLLCLYTCPATSEACTSCKQMFFKGACLGSRFHYKNQAIASLFLMEGPDQPRDRIRWRGERTTIERTRIATPHSSWIESSTETESTAIDELSLSPPAAADESPPTERSGISNQRTQPSDSPWPGKERKERTGFHRRVHSIVGSAANANRTDAPHKVSFPSQSMPEHSIHHHRTDILCTELSQVPTLVFP